MNRLATLRTSVVFSFLIVGGGCATTSGPDVAPPPVTAKPLSVPSRTPVAKPTEPNVSQTKGTNFATGSEEHSILPVQAEISVAKTPPALSTGMSLDQIINQTLLADPKLRAGIEEIQQAEGDFITSSLRPNPTLSTLRGFIPLDKKFTPETQGGPPQFDVGVGYAIDWFVFGKRAAAMQASRVGVRVTESEYADLVRQRVLEATTGYYDLLEAKALHTLAKQDVENYQKVEALTKKSVDAGNRPLVDLNRIRLDRLKSEQTLRDAENNIVQAKAKLRVLLGAVEGDPAFDVAGSLDELRTVEPLDLSSAFDYASRNRPDIEALRLKIERARMNANVEETKAYPDVIPRIGYTQQYQKSLGLPNINSLGVGLDMSLPIFDRNQGNRFKASSVVTQSTYELKAGLATLRGNLEQVDKDLRTAQENAKAVADEQLKTAVQVRDVILQSYTAGNRPLIDVLDAQRNYNETYRLFINTRANYNRALMKYQATLGKQIGQ